jgi:hypothetical protein
MLLPDYFVEVEVVCCQNFCITFGGLCGKDDNEEG